MKTKIIPVPAGTGNADYAHVLDDFVVPKLKQFEPDIIFVAAGQDSHADDLMSVVKESPGQVAPYEPCCAGYQYPHGFSYYPVEIYAKMCSISSQRMD